jgi:rhodanese-related sulfurtransferase
METIQAKQVAPLAKQGCVILDVRTDMEHREAHLDCKHIHIPLDTLDPHKFMADNHLSAESDVYILCRSGKRATSAAQMFESAGYPNVHVIEGGILACQECGTDVSGTSIPPKAASCCTPRPATSAPIPLERQVRIAAGLFVAIGSLLALTSSVIFALIPLAVGCGLIFAGITDRCGLALILTKAPWNK